MPKDWNDSLIIKEREDILKRFLKLLNLMVVMLLEEMLVKQIFRHPPFRNILKNINL